MKNVNLKTYWTSDTSGVVTGSRQAKAAVRDYEKTVSSSMSNVADAFGVSSDKVRNLTSSIQGLGVKLQGSGNAAIKAFGEMVAGASAASVAIAGLGIGAAIASFKALNATAEAFKKTVAGANLEMATAAYVSTYQQVFYDLNSAQGKAFANFMDNLKKIRAGATAIIGSLLVGQSSDVTTAFMGLASPTLWKNTVQGMRQANEAASRAEEIQLRIGELKEEGLRLDREEMYLTNRVNALKLIAVDKKKSEVERTEALAEAERLLRQYYTERYDVESEIADLMDEQNDLASSSYEDIRAANEQRRKANDCVSQMDAALKWLITKQNNLTQSVKETTVALGKEAEARLKAIQVDTMNDLNARPELYNLGVPSLAAGKAQYEQPIQLAGLENGLEQSKRVVVDLKAGLQELGSSSAEAIGELVGNLINGENAWASFGNAAAGAIADMAVAVGKAIMQEGIAIEAAKIAMTSLSGVGAIAAGAALIAIGTALKTSLSNVASGNYSASASVASSSYGRGTSASRDYSGREFNVKVTGTLVGQGSSLVAVINSENNRRSHTT